MKEKSQIRIFISYRRKGGIDTARWLHDQLKARGYNVFLDMESLRSGAFNTALYQQIKNSDVFLMVLTKDALNRCVWQNDWVRQEVAYALRCGLKIIPVMKDNYEFPDKLPADIAPLRVQNGLRISFEFFDAFMNKLEEYILSDPESPAPYDLPEPPAPRSRIKVIAAALCGVLLLVGLFFGIKSCGEEPQPLPTNPTTEATDPTTEPTEPTTEPTTEPSETTAPTEPTHEQVATIQELGNTTGNLCNDGVCSENANFNGNPNLHYVNLMDNWHYWYNSSQKKVYARHEDNDTGEYATILEGVDVGYLLVTTDWFYYTAENGNIATLYRAPRLAIDQMGEAKTLVSGFSANNDLMIDGTAAYYWYTGKGLYRLDLQSGEEVQLLALEATWETDTFGISGDWIYMNTHTEIRRLNPATGEVQTLLKTGDLFGDNQLISCNVDSAWVYFALNDPGEDTHTHNDRVYRMHIDGSSVERVYVIEGSGCSIRHIGLYSNKMLIATGCARGQYRIELDTLKHTYSDHSHEEGFAQTIGVHAGNLLTNLCNDAFATHSPDGASYHYLNNVHQIHWNRFDTDLSGYQFLEDSGRITHGWTENGERQTVNLLEDVLCHYLYVTPDWFYCVLEENGVNTLYRAENKPEEHTIGQLETVVSGFLIEENNIAIKDGYVYYWMDAEGLYRARTDGTGAALLYDKGGASGCYGWHIFQVTQDHLYFWVAKAGLYSVSLEDGSLVNLYSYNEVPGQIAGAVTLNDKIYYILQYFTDGVRTEPDQLWSINLDGTEAALLAAAPDLAMDMKQLNVTMYSILMKAEQDGQVCLYKISPSSGEMTLVDTYE